MRRAALGLALALLAGSLAAPASSLADGDPASDVLLAQDAYYPYDPPVSKPASNGLARVLKGARRAGAPTKVAVIATTTDLGAVPDFFGKPQEYAAFLNRELRLVYPDRRFTLVTVMPAGIGVVGPGATSKARDALRGIELSSGGGSELLVDAAAVATEKIGRANGKPVPIVVPFDRVQGGGGGGLSGRAVIVLLELLALALGVVVAVLLRRRADARAATA
jgi:hypothetical protein